MVMATLRRSSTKSTTATAAPPFKRSTTTPVKKPLTTTVGASTTSTFANSKFFQKRLNSAAIKIQALCRAFLVQARIFRQRSLEPLVQELNDVEGRKMEELRRISEQMNLEKDEAPVQIKDEMEASQGIMEALQKEVDAFKEVNEELKGQIKALKKTNKELQLENTQHSDADFKLQVQIQRLTKEIKVNEEDAARYQFALEDGNLQKQEMETALLRASHQRSVFKKAVGKILKMVEDKAGSGTGNKGASPPASPRRGRRGSGMTKSKSKKKLVTRSKSSDEVKIVGSADYDWASSSYDLSNALTLEDDDKVPGDDSHTSRSHGSKKLVNSKDNADHHSGACFDWATKSYRWDNMSIALDDSVDKISEVRPKASRRHSIQIGSTSKSHHEQKSSSRANAAMRDLLLELKAIKKELKH